jgi:uncharacterized protein with ParB-like and HNH nuclease domain
MSEKSIPLKSIREIIELKCNNSECNNFFIPSYQRGYRWEAQQVEDLLNDIYEFAKNKDANKGFYCLQPLVVKFDEEKNAYRVIDGQQRLTTIYIILKYLSLCFPPLFNQINLFSIDYETRKKSKDFLDNIYKKDIDESNPDFYYMSNAYKIIENWFSDDIINKSKYFFDVLMTSEFNGKEDKAQNVRFIWYELDKNEEEIEVFRRLNIGKIPLSNSELIKALILHNLKDYEKSKIVAEWDYIEKHLQNDRFFRFLTKENYENTRIDFIFNLLAKHYKKEFNLNYQENDERFSFYVFSHLIKETKKDKKEFKKDLWGEVKEYFRIFEELYNNNTYYHYVGFLTNGLNKDIEEIINLYKKSEKDVFKKELKNKMKINLKKRLEDLDYYSDNELIENLLFLFNVLITMESGYSRYPFDIHNNETEKWSLEHIHAQNSEDMKDSEKRKLLESQLKSKYIEEGLKKEIEKLLQEKKIDNNKFNKLQEKIYKEFSDEIDIHSIDNLALLSKRDNSALNNSIFPEKRAKIKELDAEGSFIPLGTKNVFMKYYSDEMSNPLKWSKKDRKAYFKILHKKLDQFIKDE